jgi:hypothetical protein
MSRRPEVSAAPAATVTNSTTSPKPVWDNPKVKMAAILLVAIVAGGFLYRTIRKRQVKKDTPPKEDEGHAWQSNFDAPRPRPQFSHPPRPQVHPGVTVRPPPRRQPNVNNQAQTPPADVGVPTTSAHMRGESTRPVREESFSDLPQPDIKPPTPAQPKVQAKDDGFTEI